MIRRILDFVFILLFVWIFMLLGFWIIDTWIVPDLPLGSIGRGISNVAKSVISVLLVLLWLWIWREIVKRTFWGALKRR